MDIRKAKSGNMLLTCRRFLAEDPAANVLPLGDLYMPLLTVSDIYAAIEHERVVGVCSIYRAYTTPSIVLGKASPEVKQALIRKAVQQVSSGFISLCSPKDADLFKKYSTITHIHREQQMIANPPRQSAIAKIRATRVKEAELRLLNKFYAEHHSEAWTPLQFKAGPYYYIRRDGKIVSAAGVHIVTPQIAQLGNIITDEAYRCRGFGTACTAALSNNLASKRRIISLFVRKENAPAIHMYEKLGFKKVRNIALLAMRKKQSS